MKRVMVRYTVKADRVAENEELVGAVYEELARTQPDGFRYATFRLDDGVSFAHIAFTEDGLNPLADVAAFARFQQNIRDRLEKGPVVAQLTEIGSFRL